MKTEQRGMIFKSVAHGEPVAERPVTIFERPGETSDKIQYDWGFKMGDDPVPEGWTTSKLKSTDDSIVYVAAFEAHRVDADDAQHDHWRFTTSFPVVNNKSSYDAPTGSILKDSFTVMLAKENQAPDAPFPSVPYVWWDGHGWHKPNYWVKRTADSVKQDKGKITYICFASAYLHVNLPWFTHVSDVTVHGSG